jgi:hypothetical protein
MPNFAALPFHLRNSRDVIGAAEITSTIERIDGLLRLDDEQLVVQWRLARAIDRVGLEIRTDHEVEPVREVAIPLHALAHAAVRWRGWRWFTSPQLVLTAADLRAFEEFALAAGLQLAHPATVELRIHRGDHLAAQEFAADLNLARVEYTLPSVEPRDALPPAPAPQIPAPDALPRSTVDPTRHP